MSAGPYATPTAIPPTHPMPNQERKRLHLGGPSAPCRRPTSRNCVREGSKVALSNTVTNP